MKSCALQTVTAEKEEFIKDVEQVLHDIRSPLTSLYVMAEYCSTLQEKDRSDFKNIASTISDIANNLLNKYKKPTLENIYNCNQSEDPYQLILASTFLNNLLSEKKSQYQATSIKFNHIFASHSHFACLMIQVHPVKQILSNIIDNIVNTLNNKGSITLGLKLEFGAIIIAITIDNQVIPSETIDRIINDPLIIADEALWTTPNLVQETLEKNGGVLNINSTINSDTTIKLTFPKAPSPKWLLTTINLNSDDTLIILDDDESIHSAWEAKLETIKTNNPSIKVIHFTDGNDFLNFISNSNPDAKQKFLLLSDYELLNQELNGLQIIKESKLTRTVLVTSHFDKLEIQAQAEIVGTKILPKQLVTNLLITIKN